MGAMFPPLLDQLCLMAFLAFLLSTLGKLFGLYMGLDFCTRVLTVTPTCSTILNLSPLHLPSSFTTVLNILAKPTVYHGETSRNLYTRAGEHYRNYHKREEDNGILKHQLDVHEGAQTQFSAKVTNSFRDCLTRQVSKAVTIRRSEKKFFNRKSKCHQSALFTVRSEIVRG